MKKVFAIILSAVIILSLVGCGARTVVSINTDNNSTVQSGLVGKSSLTEIGDGLWYDTTTGIVYWWNGCLMMGYQSATTPSPYYAPNGLPYRYNPTTNTFEEIVRSKNG